jgi:putative ABC transport system permease protein
MSAAGRKAVRDLFGHRSRTVLVVLAIAAGISSFEAVLSSRAILTRALNDGYRATNPASATLRLDSVDAPLLAAVRANPEVAAAEARRVVAGRLHGRDGWRTLVLFAFEAGGRIAVSRIVPEKGDWPPRDGEILIERDAFSVARARIGDTVLVRTAGGTPAALRVSGSVHDVGQAQARMENVVYGYVTLGTLERLGESRVPDRLLILVARRRLDEGHVRRVADGVARTAEALGHPVLRVDVPKPGEHPHAAIMGLLMLVMAVFGFLALLLSGILVVNLMTAILAGQVRQIGIMQALGGTRARIASIYLAQAAFLGGLAIVVSVPLGLAGGRVLTRAMARFLNFDVVSWGTPPWVFLLVSGAGLLVPVAAAARPVWKGCGVPVREALTDFGVSASSFGRTRFDRALAGVGGAARPILLSFRNAFRKRARLALTAATLAAGGAFFMSALNVRASMIRTLDRLFGKRKFDLSVTLASVSPGEAIDRAVAKTPGIARSEGWIAVEGSLPPAGGPGAAPAPVSHAHPGVHPLGGHEGTGAAPDRFTVLAVPAETRLVEFEITEGRGLRAGEKDAMVVNSALAARDPRFRVGRTVDVAFRQDAVPWRIVGIAREPFSPPVGYVPKAFFDQFHPGGANALRIALTRNDAAALDRVREELDANLASENVRVVSAVSRAESRFGFDQHMLMIYVFLVVVSSILGAVGGLGLMTTVSLTVLERRRELGVLRAIGATPGTVAAMVMSEALVPAALGWAAAAAAAWPLGRAVARLISEGLLGTEIVSALDARGAVIWLAVCLAFGVAASLLPAWKASRTSVRGALDYE